MRTRLLASLATAALAAGTVALLPPTSAQAAAPRPDITAWFSPSIVAAGAETTFTVAVTGPSSWSPGTSVFVKLPLAATKAGCPSRTIELNASRKATVSCIVTLPKIGKSSYTVNAAGPKKAHRSATGTATVVAATAPGRAPAPAPAPAPVPAPEPVPAPAPPTMPGSRAGADNTGVPTGVALRASAGLTITRAGTVIDGLHIRGRVVVKADNVTIRRTIIDSTAIYPVQQDSSNRGLVVEDSEIDGNGKASVAILKGNYTLRRVDIHSVKDGPRIEGDNVLIEDSWIHDLTRVKGGHHDTIQIRKGINIILRGNSLTANKSGDPMNAAIQIGSALGTVPISGLLVEDNFLDGGNYTINGGSSWVTKATYRNNRFGRNYRYGVKTNLGGGSTWESSNVFDDSSKAAK